MGRRFGGVRAPSTLDMFLRSFTHGHVQQLDKAGAGLLAGLADRVPGVVSGAGSTDRVAFVPGSLLVPPGPRGVDVDDTIREVHGYAKQTAAYGYTVSRGPNLQLVTLGTPTAAPVIACARLRNGKTASHTGAFVATAPAAPGRVLGDGAD